MKRAVVAISVVVVGMSGLAGLVFAQDNPELADAHHELELARQNLEAAARDVARLSARANEPFVGGVVRSFEHDGRRAILGINIEDTDAGVSVVGVSPGGPADLGGVETGDIVVALGGAELIGSDISSPSETLIGHMAHVNPGDVVTLEIRRGDEELELEIEAVMIRPQNFAGAYASPAMPFLQNAEIYPGQPPMTLSFARPFGRWADMELVELTPVLGAYFGTDEGILIVRAPTGDELQLQDGDVILEIGGRMPMSTSHAMRILTSFEPGETLELTIMRDQRRQTLEIELVQDDRRG